MLRETGRSEAEALSRNLKGPVMEIAYLGRHSKDGGWQTRVRLRALELGAEPHQARDYRRTAASGMANLEPPVSGDIIQRIRSHSRGVTAIYQRSERLPEQREALERWFVWLERIAAMYGLIPIEYGDENALGAESA